MRPAGVSSGGGGGGSGEVGSDGSGVKEGAGRECKGRGGDRAGNEALTTNKPRLCLDKISFQAVMLSEMC